MRYIVLSKDPLQSLPVGVAHLLVRDTIEKYPVKGLNPRLDLFVDDTFNRDSNYRIGARHDLHLNKLRAYLDRRHIRYSVEDVGDVSQDDFDADPSVGAIYIGVLDENFSRSLAQAEVESVAAEVHRMYGGRVDQPFHAGITRVDDRGYYWVGFNQPGYGQLFVSFMKIKGVDCLTASTPPSGKRRPLPLVELPRAHQSDRDDNQSGQEEQPPAPPAQASGGRRPRAGGGLMPGNVFRDARSDAAKELGGVSSGGLLGRFGRKKKPKDE